MEVPLTPGEEKPKSTEKKSAGRVRNAAEVLQQWLHFRASDEKPEVPNQGIETDDDDEEEEEVSVKRWRNVFKKFFRSHVSKQDQPNAEPSLPLFMTEALSSPRTQQSAVAPTERVSQLNVAPEVEQPTVTPEQEIPLVVEKATVTPVEAPMDPMVAARYEQPELQEPALAGSVATAEVAVPLQPTSPENQSMYTRASNEAIPNQQGDVYDDTVAYKDEINLRRSNLVNTYRNHRRKKDIREANKQIEQLKQDQKETTEELKRQAANTPVVVRPSIEQSQIEIPQVPISPNVVTRQPEQTQRQVEVAPTVVTKPELPTDTKEPESLKEILQKRAPVETKPNTPQVQKQAEKLASHSYETVNPNAVLEQVEQAAEADVAIESLFEHRHEVKDNDSDYKADVTSNAPAGSFISVIPTIHAVSAPLSTPQAVVKPARRYNKPKNSEEAYMQAAMSGFWAALILLVFIGILLVIR